MAIYEQLKNPLQEEHCMDKIIESYINHYVFYNGLTKVKKDSKITSKCLVKDRDDLYTFIFNDWKYIINELVRRKVIAPSYQQQANALVRYLNDKNPKTYEEVLEIMDEEDKPSPLKESLETFGWDRIGRYSGWEHLHSNYIRYRTSKNQEIKHRLYINCDSIVVHKIALEFIKKCNAAHLSYYFKFDDVSARSDTLVVYSDKKHLPFYIKFLNEIVREQHLEKNVHEPPILTGKINSFIGYGSEPQEAKSSFNEKRAKHIEGCIKLESASWMIRNLNSRFHLNGKETSYQEYLILKITKKILERVKKYAENTPNYQKRNGYRKIDLESKSCEELVRREVRKNLKEILTYYSTGKYEKFEIPFLSGKIKVTDSILEDARKEQVSFIYNNSKRFISDLKTRIISTSSKVGIDPNNYACDLYVLNELQEEQTVGKVHPTTNIDGNKNYVPKENPRRGMIYQKMTDEEIEASRKKLGM